MGVLIVDPDIVGSRFLSFVLEAEGYCDLRVVSTGRDALTYRAISETSLLVTEIGLPDMDGGQLCEALRSRHYHGPIIVMSEQAGVLDRVRSFDSGADDFIAKPIDPSEFLARIAAVTSRYHHDDLQPTGRSLRVGDAELSIREMTLTIDGREPVRLTPTELRLIECLMRNADVAVSRDTLINRTWGFDVFGESNRLDVYVRRLRRKIEYQPASPDYLVTVRSVGYAFRSHDAESETVEVTSAGTVDGTDRLISPEGDDKQYLDTRIFMDLGRTPIPAQSDLTELIG